MSYSYKGRKKQRRAARSQDEKSIARRIRSGEFPRFSLAKDAKNPKALERRSKKRGRRQGGLTLRLISSMKVIKEAGNETK